MDIYQEIFEKTGIFFDVFDRMQDEIFIYDKNCCLQYKNKAAERAEGSRLSTEKGKSAYELYDFIHDIDERTSPMMVALKQEKPINNIPFHYYVNGRVLTKIVSSSPIYYHGELVGTYTIQRDNTIAEENIRLQRELQRATMEKSKSDKVTDPFSDIIGTHSKFSHCISQARQSASTDSSVLLVGCTGCGKEVLARAIHQGSPRAKFPFLTLNCAAIPENLIESLLFGTTKGVYTGAIEKEGLFQQANGGTVFLDEINSMPLTAQAKLLRVLEDKKIMKLGDKKEISLDIRIISSMNQQPLSAIQDGNIREDLYYRLSVVSILLPTLKERKEDIPELIDYFIKSYNKRFSKNVLGIEDEVMDLFMKYP
ncbi:MAG: sigma 54-interacting transcriptional regulator [Lachnospiraceae bacterium]|nr:sigma 54-interacting transcriptional regulator [Lachnospiraceae bacterium]